MQVFFQNELEVNLRVVYVIQTDEQQEHGSIITAEYFTDGSSRSFPVKE